MTAQDQAPAQVERRLTPDDLRRVEFSRAGMLRAGYDEGQVDRFLDRVAAELARSIREKAELRDRVHALQQQVEGAAAQVAPSEQALRIIATAQQTADAYVADAEDFSKQMTRDARVQYEEQLRQARENAGAVIQAAQEAAARMTGGTPAEVPEGARPSTEELEQQVAYLKAFGQAVRTQLRSYLESLLTHVETEWGRADPGAMPQPALRAPAQRAPGAAVAAPPNIAADLPPHDGAGTPQVESGEVGAYGRRG
jgi:DivIVA domain-containing protein